MIGHRVHLPDGATFRACFNHTPGVGETFSTIVALATGTEQPMPVFLVVAVHHYAVTDPRMGIPATEVHVVPAEPR